MPPFSAPALTRRDPRPGRNGVGADRVACRRRRKRPLRARDRRDQPAHARLYFLMITLAFAQMLYYFFVPSNVWGRGRHQPRGALRLPGIDMCSDTALTSWCWSCSAAACTVEALAASRFGAVLAASAERSAQWSARLSDIPLSPGVLALPRDGRSRRRALANQHGFVSPTCCPGRNQARFESC